MALTENAAPMANAVLTQNVVPMQNMTRTQNAVPMVNVALTENGVLTENAVPMANKVLTENVAPMADTALTAENKYNKKKSGKFPLFFTLPSSATNRFCILVKTASLHRSIPLTAPRANRPMHSDFDIPSSIADLA